MSSHEMQPSRAPRVERLESRTMLDAMRVGPEFHVNTSITSDQSFPSVGMDADGDFVVAWFSEHSSTHGDVFAQRYDAAGAPVGEEFQVNSTANVIYSHAVGMGPGGEFVVAWDAFGEIYAQRYTAAGARAGGEFQVNVTTTNSQSTPAVAVDADGEFTIVWGAQGQGSQSPDGVYARRYSASGAAQGGELRVSTSSSFGSPLRPRIAMRDDGTAVIAWQTPGEVRARRIDAAGVPQGDEIRVNTHTDDSQNNPSVGISADGSFVIAWDSFDQDGSDHGVYAQRYGADGTARDGEFLVNTVTFDSQQRPFRRHG